MSEAGHKAVFLRYASHGADAVQRICEVLPRHREEGAAVVIFIFP